MKIMDTAYLKSLIKNKIFIAVTAVAVITVIITVIMVTTITASGNTPEHTKYYKSIIIEPGDTLWNIAEEHYNSEMTTISEYIYELKEINGITNENIKSGNYLVISYYLE